MDLVKNDNERFDESLSKLFYYLKSYQTWKNITNTANIDIDRTSLMILHIIAKSKKSLRINDLAKILEIEAPSISRKIKYLEDSRLVERIMNEEDKRSAYFKITSKAVEIDKKMRACRQNLSNNVLKNWNSRDRLNLVKLFDRFVEELIADQKGD